MFKNVGYEMDFGKPIFKKNKNKTSGLDMSLTLRSFGFRVGPSFSS